MPKAAEKRAPSKRARRSTGATKPDVAASGERGTAEISGVLTTPERPVYPQLDFTKIDLARYYQQTARWIVPYLRGRPLTLVRCERGVSRADGLRSECKFLRHEAGWHRWASSALRRVQIPEQKKIGEYLVADDAAGLLALVQGNILELHCWNTRVEHLEQPDQLVFDLDPGPEVPWARVIEAAELVRSRLAAVSLASFPKLTGGAGLHVLVPFRPELAWDAVYRFSAVFAEAMARAEPKLFTVDFRRARRRGRVLLDYKRNHRGAVVVAAYSPRAHPRGAVSVPVSWKELTPALRSDGYDVLNLPARLAAARRDPFRDYYRCDQRLTDVLRSGPALIRAGAVATR